MLDGPLYSVYLSLFSRVGATTYFDHKMASILAGTAVIVVAAFIGRRLGGPVVGLVAALFVAVYPNLWVIDVVLFPEGLFVLLCGLAILTAFRWRDHDRWALTVLLGALIGLAALTRGEGVFLAPLMVVPWVLWSPGRTRRVKVQALAGVGIGLLATLGPWMVRNLLTFEEFVPLSTNGSELHVYSNCPDTYSGKFLGYWVFGCQERLRAELGDPPGDESQTSLYWREQGFDYVLDHLDEVPKVVLARVGRQWELFRPLQNVEFAAIENRPRGPTQLGLTMYYGLVGLAFVGGWRLRRERRPWLPVGIQFVAVTVTAAYAYGTIRFRAARRARPLPAGGRGRRPLGGEGARAPAAPTPTPTLTYRPGRRPGRRLSSRVGILAAAMGSCRCAGCCATRARPWRRASCSSSPSGCSPATSRTATSCTCTGPGSCGCWRPSTRSFGVALHVERLVGFAQQIGSCSACSPSPGRGARAGDCRRRRHGRS